MPYATDADLLARYASATAVAEATRLLALDDAEEEIDAEAFRGMTVRAHCLLAMHYLQLDGLVAGESGPVTARSAGEISVSYASPPVEVVDGLHSATRYGRMFDAIAAKVIHPLIAV